MLKAKNYAINLINILNIVIRGVSIWFCINICRTKISLRALL